MPASDVMESGQGEPPLDEPSASTSEEKRAGLRTLAR